MRSAWKIGVSAALSTLVCAPSFAADDQMLVRVLTRADIAHNFAYYCAQYDPSIIARTKSSVGDMQALMLHIRKEVTTGLPQDEANKIIVRSANAARIGALMAIRKQYGPGQSDDHVRLANWCENSVVPSLNEFVVRHDEHHNLFDDAYRQAKQYP